MSEVQLSKTYVLYGKLRRLMFTSIEFKSWIIIRIKANEEIVNLPRIKISISIICGWHLPGWFPPSLRGSPHTIKLYYIIKSKPPSLYIHPYFVCHFGGGQRRRRRRRWVVSHQSRSHTCMEGLAF